MPSIGKPVFNISAVSTISFGTIVEEKTENSWKWYRVSWVNKPPENSYNKSNYNPETGWFRCDTVSFFEPLEMISEIGELVLP